MPGRGAPPLSAAAESRAPLLNSGLRWFLAAMVLANVAAQMAYALLSLYLIELGASVAQVGLVYTVAALVPMALQILGGWLSDTIGRLRAIALGSSISVFGYVLFLVSGSWPWVMVGLGLEYASGALVGPSFGAYVAEQSSESGRGRVFGLVTSIYMTVAVLGPALAGLLVHRISYKAMFALALVLYAGATAVRLWMSRAERFAPRKAAEAPTWRGLKAQLGAMAGLLMAGGLLTWIWVTDAVQDTAANLVSDLFPIYAAELGGLDAEQIGLLGASWGVGSILAALIGGWLTDRAGERTAISLGFGVVTLSLAGLLAMRGFYGYLTARFAQGLGVGLLLPAYDVLISRAVPEERRGLAFGLFGTSIGILSLPVPWIGAQLWERFGPQTPFRIAVVLCAISVPIAWAKFRLPKPAPHSD